MSLNHAAPHPLVSIIVAVRNAETTLQRTLESALNQSYPHREIIVIDGASTDGTVGIATKFRDDLAVFISEPDRGIADAYNKGIRKARGDWIYFLNADDIFSTNTVLAEIFERGEFTGYDLVVGRVLADTGRMFDGRYSWQLLVKNTVHHQAIFYRGALLKRLEYNSQYRRYGHDHEHNLMLWKSRARVAYLAKTIALWSSAGISYNAQWRDYKEEFHVRRNVVGRYGWLWNGFTVLRFGFKKARAAVRNLGAPSRVARLADSQPKSRQ